MPQCYLGLGGNVGDVARTFASALDALVGTDAACRVVCTSSLYVTRPVGADSGGEFLNAVAEVETDLEPLALLARMQQVESALGRSREVRWGPRTLDLDLLLYGDEIIDEPALSVPHPALWYRRFVLDPLAEIAAAAIHPAFGAAVSELRRRLLIRPFRLQLAANDAARLEPLSAELRRRFPQIELETTAAAPSSGKPIIATVARLNALEDDIVRGSMVDGDRNGGILEVPDDDDGGLEFLSAVIAAATDEPVVAAGPLLWDH